MVIFGNTLLCNKVNYLKLSRVDFDYLLVKLKGIKVVSLFCVVEEEGQMLVCAFREGKFRVYYEGFYNNKNQMYNIVQTYYWGSYTGVQDNLVRHFDTRHSLVKDILKGLVYYE